MGDYQQLAYEEPAPDVASIVMDWPDKLNAQGTVMTYELDDPQSTILACFPEEQQPVVPLHLAKADQRQIASAVSPSTHTPFGPISYRRGASRESARSSVLRLHRRCWRRTAPAFASRPGTNISSISNAGAPPSVYRTMPGATAIPAASCEAAKPIATSRHAPPG